MFTVVDNKVYLIEAEKMFPVNISKENGIVKVGQLKDLPSNYPIYTIQEIFIKFNIEENKPYYFDKEAYEKEVAEKEEQRKAEEKEKIKEEVRKELQEDKEPKEEKKAKK